MDLIGYGQKGTGDSVGVGIVVAPPGAHFRNQPLNVVAN